MSNLSIGYQAYLLDAQEQVAACKKKSYEWGKRINSKIIESITKLMKDYFSIEESPSDQLYKSKYKRKLLYKYKGGETIFLDALLQKLQETLGSPFDINLIVTGIFSNLARLPIPLFYSFLFSPSIPLLSISDSLSQEERINSITTSVEQSPLWFVLSKVFIRCFV